LEQYEEWEIEDKILEAVNALAISKLNKFYPTYVSKVTEIPLDIVFKHLNQMAGKGRISLLWELRCEECFRTLDTVSDIIPYLHKESMCKYCGSKVTFTRDNIFPVFYISSEYKQKQRSTQVKKNSH